MGRAIVRHPQAFLMDEPLSNLDAKLRVQMRAEIARIQNDLGVTTIYVTHDQTEAMTMGDRVAVIRKGELQQVDTPQALYEHPVNLFVAGFIGSPAMNLFEARLTGGDGAMCAEFGGFRLPVPAEVVAARPDLQRATSTRRSCWASGPRTWRTHRWCPMRRPSAASTSIVELREALGSDVVVHFTIDAPQPLTDDVRELAVDVGAEALEQVEAQARRGQSNVLARLNPRTQARKGEPIELVVDTHRLHFFDPGDGTGIYGDAA